MKEQARIWAHVAPKLELGTVWSASVWVCLLSEALFVEGDSSNITLFASRGWDNFLFCNRFIPAQKYHGLRECQAVEGCPFSSCIISRSQHSWTVKSVESNWEMQISLWHLEEGAAIYCFLVGWY